MTDSFGEWFWPWLCRCEMRGEKWERVEQGWSREAVIEVLRRITLDSTLVIVWWFYLNPSR